MSARALLQVDCESQVDIDYRIDFFCSVLFQGLEVTIQGVRSTDVIDEDRKVGVTTMSWIVETVKDPASARLSDLGLWDPRQRGMLELVKASAFRPWRTTLKPCEQSSWAIPLPIPSPDPV